MAVEIKSDQITGITTATSSRINLSEGCSLSDLLQLNAIPSATPIVG